MSAARSGISFSIGVVIILSMIEVSSADIYRYRDKNGVWHFSDKEKPGTDAEVILVEPDRRSGQKPDQVRTEAEKQPPPDDNATPGISFPMTISPSEAKKLKEDAEKVKAELEKRYEEIGKHIGDQ